MYVALKIAGYMDCLGWTIATLCCTEPQQAVFRSCNALRNTAARIVLQAPRQTHAQPLLKQLH